VHSGHFVSPAEPKSPHAAPGDGSPAPFGVSHLRTLARLRAVIVLAILLPSVSFAAVAVYL
jgi:hypothetical protein